MAANGTDKAAATVAGVEQPVDGPPPNAVNANGTADPMQKYHEERTKRLKAEGNSQYIDLATSDKFRRFQDDPWVDLDAEGVANPALKDGSQHKFVILGAGYGGLLFAIRLIQAGMDVKDICIVDSAGGFGGTWYWNRYPGLMCDVESYTYMPLLEETNYMPKHRYAFGPELLQYANSMADKYGLRGRASFRMETKDLTWDDDAKEWIITLLHGQDSSHKGSILTVRSQFVIAAGGLINNPKLPGIPGIEDFQGHSFHTSRWDYAYTGGSPTDPTLTNLKGKRVGIIGTGATAVQAVPHLAKYAKELYIFQRTPSSVDVRGNRPTDAEWWTKQFASKPGWQAERTANFNAHVTNASPKPSTDLVNDGWTKMPSFSGLLGSSSTRGLTPDKIPQYLSTLHALDYPRQDRIRARVDAIVHDPHTASKLKPWYAGWCKRPCFHDEYLQSFNQPNVHLIDTDGRGVEALTTDAVITANNNGTTTTSTALDALIFGTGFRSPAIGSPASRAGMNITGRNGLSLDDKWAAGVATLHGVVSRGFPNLFFPGPVQAGATANQMFVLTELSKHVVYMISTAEKQAQAQGKGAGGKGKGKKVVVEPSAAAEEEWSMCVLAGAGAFAGIIGCTPSYYNREGEADKVMGMGVEAQMKAGRGGIWGPGIMDYVDVIEGWRDEGGMRGIEVTAV